VNYLKNRRCNDIERSDVIAFTNNCVNGEPAPCTVACPLELNVRSFLDKVSKGKWNAAYKILRGAVLFPSIVGALCSSPCENVCACTHSGGESIALRMLEDACAGFATSKKPDNFVIPPKTARIAVVGAGLAGLSAALCLAQKKYSVTVFEAESTWGGSLQQNARFNEFDADIAQQFASESVDFRFNAKVVSLDDLHEFELIYVATGEKGEDFGLLPGWDGQLLTTAKEGVFLGGALSGADTAMAIAQSKLLSKTAEAFLQTGKAADFSGDTVVPLCKLDYTDATLSMRVIPTDTSNYSEDEAKLEAVRCLMCDCERCMISCEMLNTFRKKPKKIAIEVYSDTKVNPPYSTHTLTRQAYSCNMCGHCKEICPADVDIGALMHLSRQLRVDDVSYPAAFHHFWLSEMDISTGEAEFHFAPGDDVDYMFFPGCQLGAHTPEHVLKSFKFLRDNANVGIYTSCCGAPAYWAGNNKRQDENFEQIRAVWNGAGQPVFVFACATCESVFAKFVPEIRRTSLYELMAKWWRGLEREAENRLFDMASVFDPCNSRENPEIEKAVRTLAERSDIELAELPVKNRCCGYGGHIRVANPKLYENIASKRADISEDPYIVYCSNCREVFISQGKSCMHILDVVFNAEGNNAVPHIDQKRQNALIVKRELMKELLDEEFIPELQEWDSTELIVSDDLAESMEKKLIPLSAVREAVWYAEKTGDKFVCEQEDGQGEVFRCCLEKKVLTYWVAYKKAPEGAWEIIEAYSHRMRFSKEDA